MDTFNEVRVKVGASSPMRFSRKRSWRRGTLAPTTGECKDGMDVAYDGTWGYHVDFANTAEPLYLVNGAATGPRMRERQTVRQAIASSGPIRSAARGHRPPVDGWDDQGVGFIFGIDAMKNLVARADQLEPDCWARLERPAKSR